MEFGEPASFVANTINGIAAPFIAFAAALLTFLAFWVQYQANLHQRTAFVNEQEQRKKDEEGRDKLWQKERFETRFFELLKIHRTNVDQMDVAGKIKGRKLFIHFYREFRYIYLWTELHEKALRKEKKIKRKTNLVEFSYKIFFYGIGINSEKHYLPDLDTSTKELFERIKPRLEACQEKYLEGQKSTIDRGLQIYDKPLATSADEYTLEMYFYPFDGYLNHLGHYYRHLYRTVQFVIKNKILELSEKVEYMEILRAQLSDFEQLLLYYNARAWFPEKWKIPFRDYQLIHNIPTDLATLGGTIFDYYRKEINELKMENKEPMFYDTK
uniref:putative phage abortive infection protein n=1 Tax=Pedobacter schmidteae TaxID=2201271 RepID=UPI000EB4CC3D|nr:putative phage abortive infection protein [Pedobacter schmidteae]